MKKLIFTKWYFDQVEDLIDSLIGNDLTCFQSDDVVLKR